MKRIIAGTMLALPLAIASIPTQASAFEVIVNPRVHTVPTKAVVARRIQRQRFERQRWVPGRWERRQNRRVWVPGHYERY
ncbi:hypothetical protein [Scytonema sp. PRP1]|uniref:hypothetical protein n=1 Tax=Scytonema sp. PRP1 TaxID=3120513 RepID=UPI002FD473A4